jgi:hypothetical protein
MSRLIFTFETLFQVLSADRLLRGEVKYRTTPTPPGLSTSICGVSIELLDSKQRPLTIELLKRNSLTPSGVHEVD